MRLAGEHKQARKAQLQSRAELHKARLDALNAAQRHGAAAKQTTQVGASPMTQRAIADLTAAQLPPLTKKHSVVQTSAPAAVSKAPAIEAAQRPSFQVMEASTAREASAASAAGPAAVQAATPAATATAAAHRLNAQQQAAGSDPPAVAKAAGSRLEMPAGTKEKRPASPSSSRQAPKRRCSRSVSPSVAGSRGGRSQVGSQRQAASSARRTTR